MCQNLKAINAGSEPKSGVEAQKWGRSSMQGRNPKVNAGPEPDVRPKPNAVNVGLESDTGPELDVGPEPNAVNAGPEPDAVNAGLELDVGPEPDAVNAGPEPDAVNPGPNPMHKKLVSVSLTWEGGSALDSQHVSPWRKGEDRGWSTREGWHDSLVMRGWHNSPVVRGGWPGWTASGHSTSRHGEVKTAGGVPAKVGTTRLSCGVGGRDGRPLVIARLAIESTSRHGEVKTAGGLPAKVGTTRLLCGVSGRDGRPLVIARLATERGEDRGWSTREGWHNSPVVWGGWPGWTASGHSPVVRGGWPGWTTSGHSTSCHGEVKTAGGLPAKVGTTRLSCEVGGRDGQPLDGRPLVTRLSCGVGDRDGQPLVIARLAMERGEDRRWSTREDWHNSPVVWGGWPGWTASGHSPVVRGGWPGWTASGHSTSRHGEVKTSSGLPAKVGTTRLSCGVGDRDGQPLVISRLAMER
ncbi:hypothetical protein CRG98_019652 [Punica granatum]|uniref:Uncharacterized protein n=1 Tax=Punica granatum TaxID=22663 RepID=A0A2I0JUH7_PUNGR|nr:hypothetical protein CRG98_019652 [Punica granatum]